MLLLAVSLSEFLLPAVLGVVTFFLLQRSARRFSALRARDRKGPPPEAASDSTAALPELAQTEVELHERARELLARIDSKAAALEHLLRLAAAEADRLEEAIRRMETLENEAPSRRSR
jgi:hypothetical protein